MIRRIISFLVPEKLKPGLREIYISLHIRNRAVYPPILTFHRIKPALDGYKWTITIDSFEKRMDYLFRNGYRFIFSDEYRKTNEKSVILMFDDGWADNWEYLFPLLKKYRIKVTINLICMRSLVEDSNHAYISLPQIKEMMDSGLVHFESHSMTHAHLKECTKDELAYEIGESKRMMKDVLGIDSEMFVCPYEEASEDVIEEIGRHYRWGTCWFKNHDPRYTIRRLYVYDDTNDEDMSLILYRYYLKQFLNQEKNL